MNAKMTSFLMTAGAVVVGMYAYKAIAGDEQPQWAKDNEVLNPVVPFSGRRGGRRRR
tara:strand:+ start:11960 stop:12130 length:171 start_codon:yes stop_codon:yes gene_type:complete